MDAAVVLGAAIALTGALLGSLVAPLLQGRLADRTMLRKERMVLYAEAMLHVHFIRQSLRSLVEPYSTSGTAREHTQRDELKRVPDQTTARMRLIAHSAVREAWLELLEADEGLKFNLGEDRPDFRQAGSDPMEALAADYPSVIRLHAASDHFEKVCRKALRVKD
ncbi:hypothetical protein AB0F43_31815 [Kribbella sp. NPDC023972]|uniref:hypothetical protein n=1 Tax=Kribbella sp. NPDC023972 TaxID=3154795 RepID=UPI00340890B3